MTQRGPRPSRASTPLSERLALLGYTVDEVAKGTGIEPSVVYSYTLDRRVMKPGDMARLCAFLKCEPEALVVHDF